MTGFEYKVVPAPRHGVKAKGVKGTPARFAYALQTIMNQLGAAGWEYQRTDTLPVQERQGLTGKTTTFQNMLVFRRAVALNDHDTPVIAALIEDQTDVIATDHNEPDDAISAPPVPAPDVPVVATVDHSVGDDHAAQAAQTIEGQDRVSETLNAPFTFPWNKRASGAAKANDNTRRPPAAE